MPYEAALQTAVANVESAKASLVTAQLTYDSKEELYKENVVSAFDLSTAKNSLLAAKAQLAQAKAQEVSARNNLSYTVVKSPADGVVGTLPYRVGALVSSSIPEPLTTVSDNSDMYVYFSMTENQLLALTRQYGDMDEALKNMPAAQSAFVQVTRVNGGREFIVDEGLAPGDVIVAEGVGLLREGTPIKAKTAQASTTTTEN